MIAFRSPATISCRVARCKNWRPAVTAHVGPKIESLPEKRFVACKNIMTSHLEGTRDHASTKVDTTIAKPRWTVWLDVLFPHVLFPHDFFSSVLLFNALLRSVS